MDRDVAASLKDRVVVITGGARGMGRAYTDAFLEAGAKVVATDRSWSGVDVPGAKLTDDGRRILIVDMDVTKDADIDNAFRATVDRFGTADVLINNAAM